MSFKVGDLVKRFILIIIHIFILYLFNIVGTGIKDFLNLSVPGSVIGLLLLFILLISNVLKVEWIEEGAQFFVNNLVFFLDRKSTRLNSSHVAISYAVFCLK